MEASIIHAKSPPGTKIAVWHEFKFDAMSVLAALLREHGLEQARVGIEMDYLPAGDLAALSQLLPHARFTAAQAVLARLREIKTPRRSIFCGGYRASPTRRSRMRTDPCARDRAKWSSPRRSRAASTSRVPNISSL
jgi:hypothetical protein